MAAVGQLAMRHERVDLGETIRRAAAATILPSRRVDLRVDVPAGVAAVSGDPDRLEQIFRNLLSNAARHTPVGGSIIVSARAVQAGVDVTVSDTGAGIDPAHLAHVFDRFYRADESRSRATGGAGLGLAIVRQLVAAHGGSVTADSGGAGKGATFVVTLPIAPA